MPPLLLGGAGLDGRHHWDRDQKRCSASALKKSGVQLALLVDDVHMPRTNGCRSGYTILLCIWIAVPPCRNAIDCSDAEQNSRPSALAGRGGQVISQAYRGFARADVSIASLPHRTASFRPVPVESTSSFLAVTSRLSPKGTPGCKRASVSLSSNDLNASPPRAQLRGGARSLMRQALPPCNTASGNAQGV